MTINPRQMLVSSSKYSIKCPNSMKAEYITIHNTSNDASANNEVSYMINNNNQVSFHFAIDDKEVVQGLPINRNAWHCGDGNGEGNRKSIGIEICYSKSGGERYKEAEDLSIKFTAQLLKERGWGIDRVRTHKSWTEIGVKKGYSSYVKNCPHRILDEGRWNQFLNAVEAELKGTSTANKPKEPTTPTTNTNLPSDWAAKDWKLAVDNGYFSNENPQSPITREQFAIVINRLVKNFSILLKQDIKPIKEVKVDMTKNEASEWAKEEWKIACKNGYFSNERPQDTITRQETAIVVNRLRNNFLDVVSKLNIK